MENNDKRWYYMARGIKHGPISDKTLAELFDIAKLDSETMVWTEGMSDWRPLSSCHDLAGLLNITLTPPPIPSQHKKSTWTEKSVPGSDRTPNAPSDGLPEPRYLLGSSFIAGLIITETQGEFTNMAPSWPEYLGYIAGVSLGLILFSYTLAAIPLLIYYLFKKRRAPFEAKLVYSALALLTMLVVAVSFLT